MVTDDDTGAPLARDNVPNNKSAASTADLFSMMRSLSKFQMLRESIFLRAIDDITIDHDWMLEFLHRIADKQILRLIKKWLIAGVIEDSKRIEAELDTTQGAIISPCSPAGSSCRAHPDLRMDFTRKFIFQRWRKNHAHTGNHHISFSKPLKSHAPI